MESGDPETSAICEALIFGLTLLTEERGKADNRIPKQKMLKYSVLWLQIYNY